MDARTSYNPFLVSVFIFSIVGFGGQDKRLATIHAINSMPSGSQPIQLRCDSKFADHGMKQLRIGDEYQFGVQERALYFCEAISGRQIASWHAFQPGRDGITWQFSGW